MTKVTLSSEQRAALEELWFVYGNHGERSSLRDHKFIQGLLERGEDLRDFYSATQDCRRAVDLVISKANA